MVKKKNQSENIYGEKRMKTYSQEERIFDENTICNTGTVSMG